MSGNFTFKELVAIAAISGATALNVFVTGSLTVALPTVGKELNFKQADLQWPVNVYALSYGCLLLFLGRVGDIVGAKITFIAGCAWFSIWSLPIAFAPSAVAFICFMALMGLGAAANTPAAVSILSSTFEPGVKRNKAFAALGAGQPIGFILGLMLGGFLTDSRATWRSLFYIQSGLGFVFCLSAWFFVPSQASPRLYTKGLDWGGAILCTAGFGLFTYSVADATMATKGWATPHIPSLLSVSAVLLVAFVYYERWRERKGKSVLIPMGIFTKNVTAIVFVVFFGWWSFNTVAYFMTLYYQQVNLHDPMQTSLLFIPMAVAGFLVNIVTGYALGFVSGYWLTLAGFLGSIAAPLIFALIDVNASYWASAFLVMIFVVGTDVFYIVGMIQIVAGISDDSQGLAGGLFSMATRIGTSVGLAATSSIASSTSERYFNGLSPADQNLFALDSPKVLMVGYRAAGWTCFAAAVVAFVASAILMRRVGIVVSEDEIELDDKKAVANEGTSTAV